MWDENHSDSDTGNQITSKPGEVVPRGPLQEGEETEDIGLDLGKSAQGLETPLTAGPMSLLPVEKYSETEIDRGSSGSTPAKDLALRMTRWANPESLAMLMSVDGGD